MDTFTSKRQTTRKAAPAQPTGTPLVSWRARHDSNVRPPSPQPGAPPPKLLIFSENGPQGAASCTPGSPKAPHGLPSLARARPRNLAGGESTVRNSSSPCAWVRSSVKAFWRSAGVRHGAQPDALLSRWLSG